MVYRPVFIVSRDQNIDCPAIKPGPAKYDLSIGLDRDLLQLINTVGFCYYKPAGTEIIIQSAIALEAQNSEICVAVISSIYPNQEFIGFDRNRCDTSVVVPS